MNPLLDKAGVCRVCENQPCDCGEVAFIGGKAGTEGERLYSWCDDCRRWQCICDQGFCTLADSAEGGK